MIEYYAIVVLYNKKIQESITISHLMQLKEEQLHIIVLDNSTDDYVVENKEYFPIDLLTYHSMGGNVGLSKAYNYALSILKDKSEDDIVIWFDDDTPVKQEYFDCLKNKVVDKTFDVFVPVIYGQNGVIYSPNESGWLKGKYIKSLEQQISQNKFNAINSCLAVRLKAYNSNSPSYCALATKDAFALPGLNTIFFILCAFNSDNSICTFLSLEYIIYFPL